MGGMIRFHVLDNEIIRCFAAQFRFQIAEPLLAETAVDGVQHRNLFIKDDVGVVRHTVGDVKLSFKQIDLVIVNTNVTDIVGNIHQENSFRSALNAASCFLMVFHSRIISTDAQHSAAKSAMGPAATTP